jgi:putative transposase
MEYQRDEHRVHPIVYHLIWTPKRRKPVLKGGVAQEDGWHILELAIDPDHMHLFVRASPSVAAANAPALWARVVRHCKGFTSRELRRQYPFLKRLPSLWTRSYPSASLRTSFASTVGNVSSETIQRYIAAQRGQ